MTNGSNNQNKSFLVSFLNHFYEFLMNNFWGLRRAKTYISMATFSENFLSAWFHFSGIVWMKSFTNSMTEFVSVKIVVMDTEKRQFLSYNSNGCYERKSLQQKLESYKFKLPLKILGWLDDWMWNKMSQPQKCTYLEKRCQS